MYNTLITTEELTLDKILSYIDDYDIYAYYLNEKPKVNRPMSSPFREDKNPSWSIFRSKDRNLLWKDFATGETGNVVSFVRNVFNITSRKALERIWEDLIANGSKIPSIIKKSLRTPAKTLRKRIGIQRKYFTKVDDKYWNQYLLDRLILKYFNVSPIQTFWVNDIKQSFFYSKEQPMYAYKVYNKFKIYRPYSNSKADKWRNNCGPYDLQGLEQLPETGDLLIITKSLKDVMVLYKLGYNAVAPQSENSTIPEKVITELKKRFKTIVVFFDNDEGGIKGANKLHVRFSLKNIFISKHFIDIYSIKDISDFIKEMGEEQTKELLKELLV